MAVSITCPACAGSFTPADDLRGKKAFCPKCGLALVVTSGGVAKGNETRRAVPARTPPARSFNPLWLLLPLLLLLLLLPGGLAVYLFTRGHTDEPKQVVKNEDERPPPELELKEDASLPTKPAHERLLILRYPPAERKEDASLQTKPEVILPVQPVQPVPDKPFFDTRCIALSRDGKTLATAGLGSDIRLWDLNSGKNFRTIPFDTGYPHMPAFLALSPDGKTLAVKFWGATNAPGNPLWLYEVASGKHTTTLQIDGGLASLSFSPDGKTLLAGQGPGIATYDVASGKARIVPPANSPASFGLPPGPPPDFFDFNAITSALRPDGKILATLGMSGNAPRATIRLWDAANGRLLGGLNNFTSFYGARGGVAFSPDGKTLLWGGGNELKLFDVASGKNLASYTDDKTADIVSVAFSPDGKTAATGSSGNPAELKLWDLTSGKATVLGGQASVNGLHTLFSVVFTPDGKTLISQSLSEVKLWDVASGKCVRTLEK